MCDLSPPLPDGEQEFLPTWQRELLPLIGNMTILDLSLPGTHGTLTSDLSTNVWSIHLAFQSVS